MRPESWRQVLVSEVAEIVLGGTPKRVIASYWNGSIKWASAKDVANCPTRYIRNTEKTVTEEGIENSAAKVLPEDTVVITARGTVGEVRLLGEPMAFNQSCYGLVPRNGIEGQFLYYALEAVIRHVHSLSYGTVFSTITTKTFSDLLISLPPLPEQHRIVEILGALDDKIELNHRMNRTLEAIAQAIFKSWFVDFEPARVKMQGRQPSSVDDATAALFPDSFEDSPLGKIPKGWRVASAGESVRVVGGGTPSTKEPAYWKDGTIHWVTPKDLASLTSSVLLDTERCITERGLQQISSGLLPKGTVLLSSRAPIGYLAIPEVPLAINQGFIAMVCDRDLPNHYVLQWARANMEIIKGRANGTTFLEISKANFRPILVVIPPHRILQEFTARAEVIHQQVVNNLRQLHSLAAIRDALLPKLLSGEMRVKNAEKFVETVR